MKKLVAIVAALSVGTAFAQSSGSGTTGMGGMVNIEERGMKAPQDERHMVDFNAQSTPTLIYSWTKDKNKGTSSEADTDLRFSMNYAYSLHPNFQVGGRFNYRSGVVGNVDQEQFDVQAAGWFNFKGGDLKNSAFISASVGAGYAQTFGSGGGRDDLILTSLSIGKRFSMDRWGIKHLTWTPEIALTNTNSTANSSFDYRQATELRLIQFSVIW